jgi:hypothetical protein
MQIIRTALRKVFSAPFLGATAAAAGVGCITLSVAFSTVWAYVLEADRLKIGSGQFVPLSAKLLLLYCGIVFLSCSAVTVGLFKSRDRLAVRLGSQWKLTTALVGVALLSSVLYILLTFVVTHVDILYPHPERPHALYITSFFGLKLLLPFIDITREDAFTGFFLMTSGLVAFGVFLFLSLNDHRSFRSRLPGELWGSMSIGFLFLAADELFDIHRLVGRNLPVLRDMNIHSEPGYFIFGGYVIVALVILRGYRQELLRNRFASRVLLGGMGFQVLAFALDVYGRFWRKEEALEIAAAAMWFIAVAYYAFDEIVAYIGFRVQHDAEVQEPIGP